MSHITFAAAGDAFIVRPIPRDAAFAEMTSFLSASDVRFINLETVLRRGEGFPSAQSGGTWATSDPAVLHDLRDYGFNMVAWANNHTLDYASGGLLSTERALDALGFVHAGAGQNLESAGAIRYLDTRHGRVALIAATSTFHESWRAGAERPDVGGRPGVNPLRFQTVYRIAPEKLAALKSATSCGINAYYDMSVKEGYRTPPPEGMFMFGGHLFAVTADGREREETSPHPGDLARILAAVREASGSAEHVLVSIHSHECGDGKKDRPADFLETFSRACIEAGAHAVIGHGPHILRGIELHQGRPIFYSLGNFIFQNTLVHALPSDYYEQYGLDPSLTVEQAFSARSEGAGGGLASDPRIWHAVIPRWEMAYGRLQKMTLHPVSLNFEKPSTGRGIPRLSNDHAPLEEIRRLSEPYQTKFRFDGPSLVLEI